MGFSRQGPWSGVPCPPPGDLSDPGMEPRPLHWQADFTTEPSGTSPIKFHKKVGRHERWPFTVFSEAAGDVLACRFSPVPGLHLPRYSLWNRNPDLTPGAGKRVTQSVVKHTEVLSESSQGTGLLIHASLEDSTLLSMFDEHFYSPALSSEHQRQSKPTYPGNSAPTWAQFREKTSFTD